MTAIANLLCWGASPVTISPPLKQDCGDTESARGRGPIEYPTLGNPAEVEAGSRSPEANGVCDAVENHVAKPNCGAGPSDLRFRWSHTAAFLSSPECCQRTDCGVECSVTRRGNAQGAGEHVEELRTDRDGGSCRRQFEPPKLAGGAPVTETALQCCDAIEGGARRRASVAFVGV